MNGWELGTFIEGGVLVALLFWLWLAREGLKQIEKGEHDPLD